RYHRGRVRPHLLAAPARARATPPSDRSSTELGPVEIRCRRALARAHGLWRGDRVRGSTWAPPRGWYASAGPRRADWHGLPGSPPCLRSWSGPEGAACHSPQAMAARAVWRRVAVDPTAAHPSTE